MRDDWANEPMRRAVRLAVDTILAGEVRAGAMKLWEVGAGDLGFAGGLWQIWGRITDEYTHPDGDEAEGEQLAREAARELSDVLGDAELERKFCDHWIYERLDIIT